MRKPLLLALSSALLAGCAVVRAPAPVAPGVQLPAPQPALSLVKLPDSAVPAFQDDADTASLRTAALNSLTYYRSRPAGEVYTLATDSFTAADLASSMAY